MSGVSIRTRQFTGHVLVEMGGELDLAGAADVTALLAGISDRAPGLIVVDLAGLTFVDCSGLESLVRAQEHARRTGAEVALAGLRPQALLILRLTGRISEFAVHGSVGQAVSRSAQRTGHGHLPGPDQAQETPGLAPSMQESGDAAASLWRPEKRGQLRWSRLGPRAARPGRW